MAINTIPIFTGTPHIAYRQCNNSTSYLPIFPAASTNTTSTSTEGWFVQKARIKLSGSGPTTATVCRFYIAPDSTPSVAYQFDEISLPSITLSTSAASPNYEVPLNITLPSGYFIHIKFDTGVGAGITANITTISGSYASQ